MSESLESRFAPPVARVEDIVHRDGDAELATRWKRLLAFVIDCVPVLLILLVAALVPGLGEFISSSRDASWHIGSTLVGVVAFLVLHGWLLVQRGQTIGKMLLGLQIVRSDGSKVEAWRMLGLRYGIGWVLGVNAVLSMVFSLVDCLLIFRGSRQCLHDTIADTKVIQL